MCHRRRYGPRIVRQNGHRGMSALAWAIGDVPATKYGLINHLVRQHDDDSMIAAYVRRELGYGCTAEEVAKQRVMCGAVNPRHRGPGCAPLPYDAQPVPNHEAGRTSAAARLANDAFMDKLRAHHPERCAA